VVWTFPLVSCFAIQAATARRIGKWRIETVKVPVQGTVVAGYDEAAARRSSAGEAQNSITLSVHRLLEIGLLIITHTTFRAILTGQLTLRVSEGNGIVQQLTWLLAPAHQRIRRLLLFVHPQNTP